MRGAHFLIRSAQLVRGNTLRIGPGRLVYGVYPRIPPNTPLLTSNFNARGHASAVPAMPCPVFMC